MTLEQLTCVCLGFIIESLTFALGIFVGASLRRKEPYREWQRQGAEGSESR